MILRCQHLAHFCNIFHNKNCFSQHTRNLFLYIYSRALLCEICVYFSIIGQDLNILTCFFLSFCLIGHNYEKDPFPVVENTLGKGSVDILKDDYEEYIQYLNKAFTAVLQIIVSYSESHCSNNTKLFLLWEIS